MSFNFEWDAHKAQINLHKHGVSFEEAISVFNDPMTITIVDQEHAEFETRYIGIGMSDLHKLLVVVYTERDSHIRLISCRKATSTERRYYEQNR